MSSGLVPLKCGGGTTRGVRGGGGTTRGVCGGGSRSTAFGGGAISKKFPARHGGVCLADVGRSEVAGTISPAGATRLH